MTGWNLPPGVNESDIPGNRPEDLRREANWEEIAIKFKTTFGRDLPEDDETEFLIETALTIGYDGGYDKGYEDRGLADYYDELEKEDLTGPEE